MLLNFFFFLLFLSSFSRFFHVSKILPFLAAFPSFHVVSLTFLSVFRFPTRAVFFSNFFFPLPVLIFSLLSFCQFLTSHLQTVSSLPRVFSLCAILLLKFF